MSFVCMKLLAEAEANTNNTYKLKFSQIYKFAVNSWFDLCVVSVISVHMRKEVITFLDAMV